MGLDSIKKMDRKDKLEFILVLAEIVFKKIENQDYKKSEGRKALDKCWSWIEGKDISGDYLYNIIDNPDCIGISEFAEEEVDIHISKIWRVIVDIVAITSWSAYKSEGVKYFPQALEGVGEESFLSFIDFLIEDRLMSKHEVEKIKEVYSARERINRGK